MTVFNGNGFFEGTLRGRFREQGVEGTRPWFGQGQPCGHPLETMVFQFRGPVAGTKQGGHVISIVQHYQARLGIGLEGTAFCQPFNNGSNILHYTRMGTRDIPENWEKASSLWFLVGDKLAKVPT